MDKRTKVVRRIVLIVILLVGIIVTPVVYIITHWVEKNLVTDIEDYETYFGAKGIHRTRNTSKLKKTSESYLVIDNIFPEKLPESAEVEDFYYEYYNPWDPCYLSYLVYRCDENDYKAETERLKQIPRPTDYLIYGATDFPNPLLAVNASYYGYIYALADEAQQEIVYVELTFCNHFTDIDYEKVIPQKYLPLGFDAKEGNPTWEENRPKIDATSGGQETNVQAESTEGREYHDQESGFKDRFNQVDLKNVKIITEKELPEALEEDGLCLKLGELPEVNIHIYGYIYDSGFQGILIDKNGIVSRFQDICYMSPIQIMPQAGWDGEKELLYLSCRSKTGTSLDSDELYCFWSDTGGTMQAKLFTEKDYLNQMEGRLQIHRSEEKNQVEILDSQGNVLTVQDISGIAGEKIRGLNLSSLCTFDIHEAKVNLKVEPGLIVDGWMSPWYSDNPVIITAPVTVDPVPDGQGKKVKFDIGLLEVGTFETEPASMQAPVSESAE